jgi:hypothetical protein
MEADVSRTGRPRKRDTEHDEQRADQRTLQDAFHIPRDRRYKREL